jgi:DNA replication and repair protein RecF
MDTLSVWDEQLVEYGKRIIKRRKEFIDSLNEIIYDIHFKISGGKEELLLKYEPNIDDIFFQDELSKAKQKDLRLAQTTVGPHRDDMLFSIDGVDIRKYGSQGQQRTSALSLKLSEISFVKKRINDTPVLLLDDVLSELDSSRQNYLLNSINDVQTIITCTGLEEFVKNRFEINQVFQVIDGKVYEKGIHPQDEEDIHE